jgi:hypothetical protein
MFGVLDILMLVLVESIKFVASADVITEVTPAQVVLDIIDVGDVTRVLPEDVLLAFVLMVEELLAVHEEVGLNPADVIHTPVAAEMFLPPLEAIVEFHHVEVGLDELVGVEVVDAVDPAGKADSLFVPAVLELVDTEGNAVKAAVVLAVVVTTEEGTAG